ncbi:MAG: VWA domain-containing protein [Bryobacteraceae bacterium]
MGRICRRFAALGFAWLAAILPAQEPQTAESSGTVIRSNVREVVLDVVVRRKNLSLATRLQASDFTVTEDGVPQTIRWFRLVGGPEAQVIAAPPRPTGGPPVPIAVQANSTREPNFVSIVFDQMGADSRQNALNAATDFLDQEFQDNTYAAIFRLNLRLNAIHGFTNDRAALKEAVRKAVNGNAVELAAASANVLNETDYTITGSEGGVSINSGIDLTQTPDFSTSPAAANPLSESQQALAAMITNQRGMVDDIAGMKVWDALLQIIRQESALPGRKTVLYLSDGLLEPPGRHDFVQTVISAANRGGVTFYCIDVRGLTLASSNGMAVGLTQSAAATGRTQWTTPSSPSAAMAQAKQFDVMQQAAAAHIQLNMAELAESTGGFAVFNTSSFKKSMARIMEDVRTHYEISYVPASGIYDGKYRKIKVTVTDPSLLVQTRDGYFALPELNGGALQPFEVSALHVLNGGPRNDFGFSAAALRFKPVREGYRFEMGFELPTASLTTPEDGNTHRARVHAVFLALIKDAGGQVVGKVSQEIDREVPADKLEQFRRGETTLTLPFEAAAGRYTIEAAAIDPEGNRASTKRLSLVVPKPGESAVSTVEVVHRIVPLEAPRDPGNPLEFAGGKVTPALSQTASAESGAALFFVVYTDPGAGQTRPKPRVTVEFFRDGKAVAQTNPDVGSPDELNSFPILQFTKLPAGDYVARVTVEQGGRVSSESTSVSVNP